MSVNANYNGRQPNNTAYIKNFVTGVVSDLWKTITFDSKGYLAPAAPMYSNVYIPGDLFVGGTITNPSDLKLKSHIHHLDDHLIRSQLDRLVPRRFKFHTDDRQVDHYGLIAQEVELVFPELVQLGPHQTKAVNYLELIPLLLSRMQHMQSEIDTLRTELEQLKVK